jgi:hypothetical protein
LTNQKLHSPVPYFLLVGLLGAVPVLNNLFPDSFYPSVPPFLVEILSVVLGVGAAVMAFSRTWAILQHREKSFNLLRQVAEWRKPAVPQEEKEVVMAGRSISRLVRNADEDLREMGPDFSSESLRRLPNLFPLLRAEVEKEEDARIRLGVLGTYLGETLCRTQGWKWFFRADPALRQFSYLASVVQREGRELDPFAWAADLLTGRRKLSDFLKEAK